GAEPRTIAPRPRQAEPSWIHPDRPRRSPGRAWPLPRPPQPFKTSLPGDQNAGRPDPGNLCAREPGRTKRSPATGAARCAGDQGVPQVADVRESRSDPGSKSTRLCRWPAAWLVMESGSGNDLDGENHGDEPVDGGAKRRPPPGVGNVVTALLPEVLETMARVAKDQEPRRPGDARGGKQDERDRDGA